MTREKMLGSQVKHLLSNLSDHGTQHLTEVETDLVQTSILLGEAITKLGGSFMAIHEAVTAQQETIDLLLSGAKPTPEIAEKLKAKHGEISQHVNAAVTGLQFQDMTSQLIGRTVTRVIGLREVLSGVGSGSSGISENSAEEIVETLKGINKVLEEQSVKLESALWKAVCQTHMESGDIELF
ncbi:chemotaxis protein [Noviherbaspirillum sp. UKPF54]|uniref:chemotaxis protein n=1 Tax=Noviherbaspirillum sp. UKPF54 TaxID=2601898 RepID=UPI0011B12628|nr:chemotaxis protein [Noviherbaspirillum sp. UKPF54]QDZ28150.1 chemotaxis protein [Noviherbaspirillum sp. UKPF54]